MRSKLFAGIVIILMAMMIFAVGVFAYGFLIAPNLLSKILGISLLVLCAFGVYALYKEVSFGLSLQKIATSMNEEGSLERDTLERNSRGKPTSESSDQEFSRISDKTKADSDNYRSWYNLGVAYDDSGDRKRARMAMRTSIKLYKKSQKQ